MSPLRVPCAYQGGKQRIAPQIADILLSVSKDSETYFYDLCCGSAAVSIELVNRGINPHKIYMLDISSWGTFWSAIGSGSFNINVFREYLASLPRDKYKYKAHLTALAALPINNYEAELYPILQANSFGGKQICRLGDTWLNTCFRSYWEPTVTSVRRSPANPMQPSPNELQRRIDALCLGMLGVTCYKNDIMSIFREKLPTNSVVYIDPPYQNKTGYAFTLDIHAFVSTFLHVNPGVPLYVSEGIPLSTNAIRLSVGGANGGICGSRKEKHQEWLSSF